MPSPFINSMTMPRFLIALFLLPLLVSSSLFAQNEQDEVVRPLALDRAVLSGVGLKKIDFKDDPDKAFFQKNLFRGPDLSVYVVSSGNTVNTMDPFPFDEFVYLMHGSATVASNPEKPSTFHRGDYLFAPRGFRGTWEIDGGNHYHYEFSVITTKRAAEGTVSEYPEPFKLPATDLAGMSIELDDKGTYQKILAEGVEMRIVLNGESPQKGTWKGPESVIHLLSGQITLTDPDGAQQTFYTGDFLVVPADYEGEWTSDGHGLIKYLTVEKVG